LLLLFVTTNRWQDDESDNKTFKKSSEFFKTVSLAHLSPQTISSFYAQIHKKHPKSMKISITALSLALGAINGLFAVTLGALGAHRLHASLEAAGLLSAWETAVQYQMYHALGLIAMAATPAWLRLPLVPIMGCWVGGSLLFSGSIYGLCLGGPSWLGPVTPIGGVLLLIGWALLLAGALRAIKAAPPGASGKR
jgi:uncharacterized membrane protein YgdD (TMEM256/DUF423 family)